MAVQGEGLEKGFELDPATVETLGLEQHKHSQHQAEDKSFESKLLGDLLGQQRLDARDKGGQHADQDGAQNGAAQRTQATDGDHQDQLKRQDEPEALGRQKAHMVGQQSTAQAGHHR